MWDTFILLELFLIKHMNNLWVGVNDTSAKTKTLVWGALLALLQCVGYDVSFEQFATHFWVYLRLILERLGPGAVSSRPVQRKFVNFLTAVGRLHELMGRL